MKWDSRNIHWVPAIIQQRGEELLEGKPNEFYARTLSETMLYCQDVLEKYERSKKRNVEKVPRKHTT